MHSVTRMLARLTTTTTAASPCLPFAAAAVTSTTLMNTPMVRQLHTTDVDFRARQVSNVTITEGEGEGEPKVGLY